MASLDEFIKEERLFELFHFSGELARLPGTAILLVTAPS
jgi:hypothetical protein